MLWSSAVPTVHALTTCAIGGIGPRLDARYALRPHHWVLAGLSSSAVGVALVGLALGERWSVAMLVVGLAMQGVCLGLVVTMLQPLLASIAARRGDPNVATLLAVTDSFQSVGFIVGPLLGGAASAHHRTESALLGMALLSLALLPRVRSLGERGPPMPRAGSGGHARVTWSAEV